MNDRAPGLEGAGVPAPTVRSRLRRFGSLRAASSRVEPLRDGDSRRFGLPLRVAAISPRPACALPRWPPLTLVPAGWQAGC
ncbi:hypothetical protein WS67_18950 [Burkholderia singularis]|uniref:Uncharacterized protein n=1 Tax=Burkholderia singularis TaxID=1503053 RepID=A0A118DMR6_9BURK|nr:hypothetical protein WS67_18950 [Burkholderia singularis]